MNELDSVALVTIAPFPNGNVSTLRFTSYLKAIAKRGIRPYVIVYGPSSMAHAQKDASGVIDGITFQYSTRITWKYGNIFEKVCFSLIGIFKSSFYLWKIKPDAIILYGDNPFIIVSWFFLISKLLSSKFVGDRSELPTVNERKSFWKLKIYELKQHLFDGMIIMTKQLSSYYSRFSKRKDFIFFMPMTIDVNRFDYVKSTKKNYIAVVFGTHNRDGLDTTLKSYVLYKKQQRGTYKLMLIGDYDHMPNKRELDKIIVGSGLSDQIIIKGRVPIEEVPYLLASASCLITTPREYVSGGFPTKLGEYMLSNTPIVATIAGEMLDYIEPNIDMLMCNSDNEIKIAENLKYVEDHPNEAQKISNNAKKKASLFFNADTYIDDLLNFLGS